MTRFSQMSKDELIDEIKKLEQEEKEAVQSGWEFQAAVLKQKKNLARSYLIDPKTIQTGELYQVEDHEGLFRVAYINGVMAWGSWEGSREEIAFPLSTLKPI